MADFDTHGEQVGSNSKPGQEADEKKGQYPLVRMSDLPEETEPEIIEMITSAIERYITDIQLACKTIKEQMDRVYGPHWNVIVGEAFGFDVTFLKKHILYMFFMGNLGILVWKNS